MSHLYIPKLIPIYNLFFFSLPSLSSKFIIFFSLSTYLIEKAKEEKGGKRSNNFDVVKI